MPAWPLLLYLATAILFVYAASRITPLLDVRRGAVLVLVPLAFVGEPLASGSVWSPIDRAYHVEPLSAHGELLDGRAPSAGILHDPFVQILPWRAAVRHAYSAGEWPLWNPYSNGGEPLAGLGQSAPFSLLNLIALAVPLADEPALVGALTLLVGGLSAFLAFTGFGLNGSAALIGALGWMTSSFLLFWVQWPLSQTVALFPFVLFGAREVAHRPGSRSAALLATALTLTLFTGHHESVAHTVLVVGLWAAVELPWRRPRVAAASIGWALAAGTTALALASPFVLAHFDALEQSFEYGYRRAASHTLFQAESLSGAALQLREELVPFAALDEDSKAHAPIVGDGFFAGGLFFVLAACGAACGPTLGRRREARAGVCLVLFGLLAGIGFRPLHLLLSWLPLVGIALNGRLVFVAAFGVALLAALAVEAWSSPAPPSNRLRVVIGLTTASALTALVVYFWHGAEAAGASFAQYRVAAAWLLLPAFGAAVLLARPQLRGWILVALVAVQLAERRWEMAPLYRTQSRRAFFPLVAPLDAVPHGPVPYRFAGLWHALPPNTAVHYRLEDARGDNALTLHRWVDFRVARNPDYFDGRAPQWLYSNPSDPVLDFLNVRYLLAPETMRVPKRFRRIATGRSSVLLENPRALERAFLPRSIRYVEGRQALEAIAALRSFAELATIEPLAKGHPPPGRARNARGRVAVESDGLGYRLTSDLTRAGWIVTSIPHWRGWRARSGGADLPLAYADHAFVALRAPAGRSVVELRYRPAAFFWGLRLSAATIAALSLAAIALRRRRVSVETRTTA